MGLMLSSGRLKCQVRVVGEVSHGRNRLRENRGRQFCHPVLDERQRATQRERSAQDLTGDDRSARVSFWWPWFQGRNDGDSREYRWVSAKEKTRELHQNRTSKPVKHDETI